MARALRIAKWDRYEHYDSAKCARMHWVKTPTDHNGRGYAALIDHPDGMAHFGAWNLLLQVAANCPTRGTLVTDSGRPMDARALAWLTHGSARIFETAIERLLSDDIGWLEMVEIEDSVPASAPSDHRPVPAERRGQKGTGSTSGKIPEGLRNANAAPSDHRPVPAERRGSEAPENKAITSDSGKIPEGFRRASGAEGEEIEKRGDEKARRAREAKILGPILRGAGFPASPKQIGEWADLLRGDGQCRTPNEAEEGMQFIVKRLKAGGSTARFYDAPDVGPIVATWARKLIARDAQEPNETQRQGAGT